jgi:hypothetical protein
LHYIDVSDLLNNNIFNEPVNWCIKVIGYTPLFLKSFIIGMLCQPFFIFQLLRNFKAKSSNIVSILILLLILTPHLVAGFFDQRYYTFYFVISTLMLTKNKEIKSHRTISLFGIKILNIILYINILIYLLYAIFYLVPTAGLDKISLMKPTIEKIRICQQAENNINYVFLPDVNINDAAYSGITGLNVKFPVSFKTWNEEDKYKFFKSIGEYRLITNDNDLKCR